MAVYRNKISSITSDMPTITPEKSTAAETQFLSDTLAGLYASPKFMRAKYFYDERGDYLFQQIMELD